MAKRHLARSLQQVQHMTLARKALLISAWLASLAGCRDDGRLPTYEVTGKVVLLPKR